MPVVGAENKTFALDIERFCAIAWPLQNKLCLRWGTKIHKFWFRKA